MTTEMAMSILNALRSTVPEVAKAFHAKAAAGLIVPEETTEGHAGLVVFESAGRRILLSMNWGFPRVIQQMAIRGEPPRIVCMVADLSNPMWKELVVDKRYRYLIPITHFANPEGEPGSKTRTWFSVRDRPIVAWAGFCRNLPGVGPAYAGMTMDANAAIPPTNDRMPVLLDPDDHDAWLHGGIQDVIQFMYRAPFAAERMRVIRTDDAWRSDVAPPETGPRLPLI